MHKKTNHYMKTKARKQIRVPRQVSPLFLQPLFWVASFVLVALITQITISSFAQREGTVLPAAELGANAYESICGNGLVESGENCATCFIDSPCASSETCSAGVCLQKKFNLLILTIPAILLAILAIGLLGYQIFEFRESNKDGEMRRLSGLRDYILKSIKTGQRETEIMINVIRAGWDKNDAAMALNQAKKSLSAK